MQVCTNCKAKHYEISFVCCNCNLDLPEPKTRKAHDVYTLRSNSSVTTKRITDKFLNDNADYQGFVELLKNGTEEITYLRRYNGTFKLITL